MKKLQLFLLMLLLSLAANAEVVEIDGIFYNIVLKTKTAEVTSNPQEYKGSIKIPESVTYEGNSYKVTSIGNMAFWGCSDLISITIGNSVTSIGKNAFEMCSGLKKVIVHDIAAWCGINFEDNPLRYACHLYSDESTEITELVIPNSVTSIGNSAFFQCLSLTSVTIPNSLTSIGDKAFWYCNRLSTITIGKSVTSIGSFAFDYCSNLKKVIVHDIAAWCGIKFNNYRSNPLSYTHRLYSDEDTEIVDLVIPNSVTNIGDFAFARCTNISSITIPNSVTKIGSSAFAECTLLTSVIIPNSVTSIGHDAFRYCSNLSSVIIGTSVANIGDYVFSGCSGLTSLTIGNSVTNIGDYVFERCSNLTSVTIPNSVTHIGAGAFNHCSRITSISIGSGIKSIKDEAFSYCSELTDVTCYAESVPGTYKNAFKDSYIEYATLYVPSSAVVAYKEKEPWKYFKSIVEINPTSIEFVSTSKQEPVSYYSLDGRKIDSPKSGTVVVKKQGNRMKKVLIK